MPNIKLKGQTGETLTYENVERVYFDSADTDGEYVFYTHGLAVSKAVEDLDFSEADVMSVEIPKGELVTELTIAKPETMLPENIRHGIEVAGVTGEFIGDTEEATVGSTEDGDTYDLDFSAADEVTVEPSAETKVLSKVTVIKPEMLIPENIRDGVEVGGVKGTFNGVADRVDYTLNDGGEVVGAAFYGNAAICCGYCTTLEWVDLTNSTATSIGKNAFYGCTALENIDIPDSVMDIGESAFFGCTALTSATVGSGVASMGANMFRGCTALTNVTIKNGVKVIGNYMFYGCTALESIDIPDSVTSIGNSAFQGSGLTSLDIPDGVETIGNSVCAQGTALTNATIGNGVASIGNSLFSGCTALTNVTIGSGVASIGINMCKECTNLTSVTFIDPTIWYVGSSAGATTTQVDVTDVSTAATHLRSTHVSKYWTKV